MKAMVAGAITFDRSELSDKQFEKLRRALSFDNPEYKKRIAFGMWLGNTPKKICTLETVKPGTVRIPRGTHHILKGICGPIEWTDNRRDIGLIDFVPSVELRDYQRAALDRMVSGVQGTVIMPCGSGKTVTMIATLAAIGQPTLIIVHTKDLQQQWVQNIKDILDIEPGVVGGGKYKITPVTVATIQTLVRMDEKKFNDTVKWFGTLVVDEAHHTPASTFQKAVNRIPARHRFGLTATPVREDGLTELMRMTMGENLFEISYQELVDQGHLEQPEIKLIDTGFSFDGYYGPEDRPALMDALISDLDRNSIIGDLATVDALRGHSVLVLSDRVEHCKAIQRAMWHVDAAQSALVLTGDAKAKDRAVILEAFKNGTAKILIATTLADEGLDVPRLSRIILAYPGKSAARTTQRLGRLMRVFPGKGTPVLYDLVDKNVPTLWAAAKRRQSTYRKLLEVKL